MKEEGKKEEILTIESFKKYLVHAMLGTIISGLGVGIITGYTFFINTQSTLKNHEDKMIEVSATLNEHSKILNNMTNSEGVNDNQVKNLDGRMTLIEKNQNEIYSLLIQIASDQKTILRNK
jgi:hypothetical protein